MEHDEISIGSEQEEDVVVANDSDDNDEYSMDEDTWIEWFCKLEGNHFLVEMSEEFLTNDSNLIGLDKEFPNYKSTLQKILAKEAPSTELLTEEYYERLPKIKELYGILHKRFIYTSQGNYNII